MKRKLIIFLTLIFCFSLIPTSVFAEIGYNPDKIAVSEFSYSKNSLSQGNLNVSCKIELIDKSITSQPYEFLTVVKYGGKIISRDTTNGTLSKDNKYSVSNTVVIPQMQNGYDGIEIESYFLDSLILGHIIAPVATWSSDNNTLKSMYIDGTRIDGFDGSETEVEYEFEASRLEVPEIIVIPEDNSAKVEIADITDVPGDINIKVTSAKGNVKNYTLKLKVKDGTVSSGYMLKDGSRTELTTQKMIKPSYSSLKPGDTGFDWDDYLPQESTLVYSDRTMYYYQWPDFLDDAVAVQTNLNAIRNDNSYKNKGNIDETMGEFTVDRSCNIYLYTTPSLPAWAKKDGFVKCDDAKVSMYYRNQDNKNPLSHLAYKRTVVVPEGETRKIRIGAALNELGEVVNDFYILVDFLPPSQICTIENLNIQGVDDFCFDEDVFEYNIVLDENFSTQPEITYNVLGMGATVTENKEGDIPGKNTLTFSSLDGTNEKIYVFNFSKYETKLTDLKVGDKSIYSDGQFDYTVRLPYGWKAEDGFPEILATADSEVTLDVTQPSVSTMKAQINATSDKGGSKTYTVTFKETLTATNLKSITIGSYNVPLKDDVYNYFIPASTAGVSSNANYVSVAAATNDAVAEVDGATVSSNTFFVRDGSTNVGLTKEYTVTSPDTTSTKKYVVQIYNEGYMPVLEDGDTYDKQSNTGEYIYTGAAGFSLLKFYIGNLDVNKLNTVNIRLASNFKGADYPDASPFSIKKVADNSWSELTLSSTDNITVGDEVATLSFTGSKKERVTADITAYIKEALKSGNDYITLYLQSNNTAGGAAYSFYSKEYVTSDSSEGRFVPLLIIK